MIWFTQGKKRQKLRPRNSSNKENLLIVRVSKVYFSFWTVSQVTVL